MSPRRRKQNKPERIDSKPRDADAMRNAGEELAAVPQAVAISEATLARWWGQYGGRMSEEAKRLKSLEYVSLRLNALVTDLILDNKMLKHLSERNW